MAYFHAPYGHRDDGKVEGHVHLDRHGPNGMFNVLPMGACTGFQAGDVATGKLNQDMLAQKAHWYSCM